MQAAQILISAFIAPVRGLPGLLRTWLLPIVMIVAALGLFELLTSHRPAPGLMLWAQRLALLCVVYLGIGAAIWGALRQHRLVLSSDPSDPRDRLYPSQILLYCGALLLIALMLILPGAVVLLLVTQLVLPWASGGDVVGWLAMSGVKMLALTGFLFFSPVLPAIATGQRMGLAGAVSLSIDHVGTLLMLALALVVLDQALERSLAPLLPLPGIWEAAACLRGMVMISLISEVYRDFRARALRG